MRCCCTGGADGDDPAPLLHNAARLARARVRFPIVLAGNEAARDDAMALLTATGRTVVACPNVAPRPGELVPGPARAALAQLYADHVLGGRGPSVAPRFRRMVRVGTPDVVARGAALLARMLGVRVLVVDVGCATTDVHCAIPDDGSRLTVEGDLGMRAAAAGVLVEGQAEGVVDPVEADLLGPTVERMTNEVGYVPRDPGSAAEDRRIAALAAVLAVRRHVVAHESDVPGDVGLLVLTGGVFRRPDGHALAAVVATLRADVELAGLLAKARVAVDADFAVAPAGMLAAAGHDGGRPDAAAGPPAGLIALQTGGFDIAGTARDPGRVRPARAERRCSGLLDRSQSATLGPRFSGTKGASREVRGGRRVASFPHVREPSRAAVPTAFPPAVPPAARAPLPGKSVRARSGPAEEALTP